jgi:hypothetical protein
MLCRSMHGSADLAMSARLSPLAGTLPEPSISCRRAHNSETLRMSSPGHDFARLQIIVILAATVDTDQLPAGLPLFCTISREMRALVAHPYARSPAAS